MKRSFFLISFFLLAGVAYGQAHKMPLIDPQIIGRWDYLKTVGSDGSEELMIIGREHYYSDGTFMFANMLVKPYSKDELPTTHEELVAAYERYHSGLGTFETNLENNVLRIKIISTSDTSSLGLIYDFKYEIKDNIIIFDDTHYFRRVND